MNVDSLVLQVVRVSQVHLENLEIPVLRAHQDSTAPQEGRETLDPPDSQVSVVSPVLPVQMVLRVLPVPPVQCLRLTAS